MVASLKGLKPEKDCAGKSQQHIQKGRPVLSSERAPHEDKTGKFVEDLECDLKNLFTSNTWSV
jgi:hypothetical protein